MSHRNCDPPPEILVDSWVGLEFPSRFADTPNQSNTTVGADYLQSSGLEVALLQELPSASHQRGYIGPA